ncbi:tetratricopeptide repeat protein [Burkholderia sp. PU8-34]
MDTYDCWSVVTRFIKNKQYDKAIEFCKTEPYSALPYCQNYLGWTYYQQNENETAAYWFFKAAGQGDCEALFGLGCIFIRQGDFRSALSHLERAASKETQRSYFWIAIIYYYGGNEVPADMERAIHYFKLAADHGSMMAKRFIIFFESRGGKWKWIASWLKLIPLVIYGVLISIRNPYDSRVADVGYQYKGKFPDPTYKPPKS